MFNPDGSIKLPGSLQQAKNQKETRMKNQRCMVIKRDLVRTTPPKSCTLHIKVSDAIKDYRFIDTIFKQTKHETPMKLIRIDDKSYEIVIGTTFRRCSECNSLIAQYRSFLDGNLIDEKGSCTFEPRSFSYEDYFD